MVTIHLYFCYSYSNKICRKHFGYMNCCLKSYEIRSSVRRLIQRVTFQKHWLLCRPSTMTPSIPFIVKARNEHDISITQFQNCKSAVQSFLYSTATVKKETFIELLENFENCFEAFELIPYAFEVQA